MVLNPAPRGHSHDASDEGDRTAAHPLYCPGCNEVFFSASSGCPRCGGGWLEGSLDLTANTLMLVRASDADDEPDALPHEDDLDHLVGRSLDVYRCDSLIGRGGMGHVFLAHHHRLHRACALKVLSPRLVSLDTDYVQRFLTEGRSAAALNHPHIVTPHAIGESGGYHFLEMEYVRGRSLQRLVDQEGRVTPVRATALTSGIAEGLAEAHQHNIIHRDLKPDNVLLAPNGVPKIADFGLAKRVVADSRAPRKLVGTPYFMAPELFQGHAATPASDVYALGVCYFLLLTGRLPFHGKSFRELAHAATNAPIPSVRRLHDDITLEMAEALSLLLARTPGNRPQNGIGARQLLQAVLGTVPDLESLLAKAFPDRSLVSWTRNGQRYDLHLQLPGDRWQRLVVEPSDHGTTERLLLIYSVCCPARPEYFENALRLNAELSHGGVSLREIDGQSMFVMVDTYPRSTVDAEEIRRSVLEVGSRADEVEKLLTDMDFN